VTDDKNRIDLSDPRRSSTCVHVRGCFGHHGESESVLAISAVIDAGQDFSETARIIVGTPTRSPLIQGELAKIGGFSCSPDAADEIADELRAAAARARRAMEIGR
jgi:hypothetical protein